MTQSADITDDAVLQATGRAWAEWLALLAGEKMAERTHEELIVFLREAHSVPAWWQRAIAERFAQSLGRGSADETDDGFQVSVARELDRPAAAILEAWADDERRARWLRRGDFEPTTVRPPDTVRGKWAADGSRVDVEITEAGPGRCRLVVGHRGLASQELVERMRAVWEQSLDRLAERIDGRA